MVSAAEARRELGRNLPPTPATTASSAFAGGGATTTAAALFTGAAAIVSNSDAPSVGGTLPWSGVAGGGGTGGDDGAAADAGNHSRHPSRVFRHQSVEDELWGWFGDDRPLDASGSLIRVSSSVGGQGGGLGGGGGGGSRDPEITVSTVALTERLAKLSAGRALLDQVRRDSRSLAAVVTSAARSAFVSGDGVGAPPGSPAASDDPVAAELREARGATEGVAPRAVQFATDTLRGGEGAPAGSVRESGVAEGAIARVARVGAEGQSAPDDAGAGSAEMDALAAVAAGRDRKEGGRNVLAAGDLRRVVVEAKAGLEGLQREIRRLVREAGEDESSLADARVRVAPFVKRRAVLAAAALTDARRMATRLQEISEAQKVCNA